MNHHYRTPDNAAAIAADACERLATLAVAYRLDPVEIDLLFEDVIAHLQCELDRHIADTADDDRDLADRSTTR